MEVQIYLGLLIQKPEQKGLTGEMLVVAIYYSGGQGFCVDYVIQEIQQQKPEQPIFVMIVEEDFNEKEYKDKNLGIFHEIRKSMWLSSKRR